MHGARGTPVDRLGDLQVAGNRVGDLAVVTEGHHNLLAVPGRADGIGCSLSCIRILSRLKLGGTGQTRRATLNVESTIIGPVNIVSELAVFSDKRNPFILDTLVCIVRTLIIIRAVRTIFSISNRILNIRAVVNRRINREVIETVGVSGNEGRRRGADTISVVVIRVEIDVASLHIGMRLDIATINLRCIEVALSIDKAVLETDGVVHANRVCREHLCRRGGLAVNGVGLSGIETHGEHGGGNLHLYRIALLRGNPMGDGNLDVAQIVAAGIDNPFIIAVVNRPLEHIGRGRSIIRSVSGNLSEFLAGEHDALEILDLGVVAERVGEGQVANGLPADAVIRLNRRRCTGTEIIVDGLEHVVQLISVIRGKVVVTLGPITKRTVLRKVNPVAVRISRRRAWVVARHRIHEVVGIVRLSSLTTQVTRVCTLEDTNRVDANPGRLHLPGNVDRLTSVVVFNEIAVTGHTVGKEDDDFLGLSPRTVTHAVDSVDDVLCFPEARLGLSAATIGQTGNIALQTVGVAALGAVDEVLRNLPPPTSIVGVRVV